MAWDGLPKCLYNHSLEFFRRHRQYMQETEAVLYYVPLKGVEGFILMKKYCKNTAICRRQILLAHFIDNVESECTETKCSCCDVCALHCDCVACHNIHNTSIEWILCALKTAGSQWTQPLFLPFFLLPSHRFPRKRGQT